MQYVVPPPKDHENESYSAYVKAELLHSKQDQDWKSKSIKAKDVPGQGGDFTWNDKFEWEFEEDDLAFIRYVTLALSEPFSLSFATPYDESKICFH